jgi:hypothetical protein
LDEGEAGGAGGFVEEVEGGGHWNIDYGKNTSAEADPTQGGLTFGRKGFTNAVDADSS